MSQKKDPFRSAERETACPKCNHMLGWNRENGLAGQGCIECGYTFTGKERGKPKTEQEGMAVAVKAHRAAIVDFKSKTVSRANAAIDVYNACMDHSQSFEEDNLGANLAYLMGAILKGEKFQAWLGVHEEFVAFLHENVPSDHDAWASIDFMVSDGRGGDEALPERIKQKLLDGTDSGNDLSGWHAVLNATEWRGAPPDEVGEDGHPR